jgi:hypothetical protein
LSGQKKLIRWFIFALWVAVWVIVGFVLTGLFLALILPAVAASMISWVFGR